ncbi:putative splicing factor, arginine/serine-rich 4 [Caenorhabditis elegans]|uniref:Probable splicing factor, arginine/serine-rich 4 n=1 Tax=Caenorhabditis elegans TaxID=6239 RepID=RSP4_CAEEL|nr:putative splicing factor, arginine/serine-rich 4 [Caenorhabditis elegans]Q09511.1 RecName: Full=Probable splicing factor, arginine/serine-rich 4; AltName: Full=CeSC35; AltName: Full=RNA-binding protein srp-2 [Caenorhabditis elegans]CCD68734.1 Probable splicing factor, arginine/serine-rich 4 [Caenorhabditis elegans]|eukprot:NP_495013.1 Probable splicing factor, arginine/serine-rich 4 [Caenorhabditis elegans]
MSRGGGGDRRAAPDINGLTSLKIDNLSYQTTPNDLRRTFERYGDIGDVHIPRDKYSRQSKGFGFVRFYERRDAEHALDRTDGKLVDGRELRVTLAKYDRPSDERGGRGGGGGRRRSRSPRRRSRSPRYSRSRSPRRSRSRTRSPPSRDRRDSPDRRDNSRSRSRSPPPREDGSPKERRSRSRSASRSPSRSRSNSR